MRWKACAVELSRGRGGAALRRMLLGRVTGADGLAILGAGAMLRPRAMLAEPAAGGAARRCRLAPEANGLPTLLGAVASRPRDMLNEPVPPDTAGGAAAPRAACCPSERPNDVPVFRPP